MIRGAVGGAAPGALAHACGGTAGVGARLKSRSQSGHAGYNLDPRVALASQSNVGAFSSECIIQTAGFMMSLLPNP